MEIPTANCFPPDSPSQEELIRRPSQFSPQEGRVLDNATLFSSGLSIYQIQAYINTFDETESSSASADVHLVTALPGHREVGTSDRAKKTIPPERVQQLCAPKRETSRAGIDAKQQSNAESVGSVECWTSADVQLVTALPGQREVGTSDRAKKTIPSARVQQLCVPKRETSCAGIDAKQQSNAGSVDRAMQPLNSNNVNASGVQGQKSKAVLTPFKPQANVLWCLKMEAEDTSTVASHSLAVEQDLNDLNDPTVNGGGYQAAAEKLIRGLANEKFATTAIQADTGVVRKLPNSFEIPTDVRMTGQAIGSAFAQSDMNEDSWGIDLTAIYPVNLATGGVRSAAAEPFMNAAKDGFDGQESVRSKCPKVAKSYSKKVFVGGLPPDMNADMIEDHFSNYGLVCVTWPHRNESSILYPPNGFVFLQFEEKESARRLMVDCEYVLGGGYYTLLTSPSVTKPVQVRAWVSADADCMVDRDGVNPRNTVFVGGVPLPLTASKLADAMKIFGAVCYAGIDLDSFGYPMESARVVFRCRSSCIKAISSGFLEINVEGTQKRVELKPYVLMDQPCNMCAGHRNDNQVAEYYCAHVACLMYLCTYCWLMQHNPPAMRFHKPQYQKLSADRQTVRPPRN